MGIKKVKYYEVKAGPSSAEIERAKSIEFDPPLERWAFSVALAHIAIPPTGRVGEDWIGRADVSVSLFSERGAGSVVTHGTSEEYGKLLSLDLIVSEFAGIEVTGLLTLYEYEPGSWPTEHVGDIEKPLRIPGP